MNRSRTPVKDTYSTHDVAKICCVTPTTVIRWIEDGLIPAFKTVGGHRRVRREDLERVCSERGIPFTVQTGSEVGRILVVDDEPVVLDLIRDVVKEIAHKFEVEVARDAFDAGRLVATFRPQLIFLDLMMPGVDGFEVCTRLKRDIATQHTEVIAITGYYTEANMERILQAGAIACLKKPLDVAEVRRRVLESFNLKDERDDDDGDEADDAAPRVLLVTQNAGFRSSVKEELASGKTAIELMTAQTGADALLVAQAAPPRYVIVSLGVPDVKHSRVIEKLAGGKLSPTIIAVHDHPTDELRADARAAGARMCLPTVAVTGSVRELLGV
ncbi:MAG: response regulator [Nannocystaceae bacterium]